MRWEMLVYQLALPVGVQKGLGPLCTSNLDPKEGDQPLWFAETTLGLYPVHARTGVTLII